MRTTLGIDDDLLRRLKRTAADRGMSLQALVNELLHQALMAKPSTAFKLRLRGWRAELQPGVDLLDRDKLYDLMEDR